MMETIDRDIKTGAYQTHLNCSGIDNEEVVLFLHGSGPGATAWSNWQFTLPDLGKNFYCIAPDLIGYGKSEHPKDPPREASSWLEIWINQLDKLLGYFDFEKIHLVGNSMGGALALHLLHRRPENIGRVVLLGTMGVPFQITSQLDELWGFYEAPSPDRMAEVINRFVYEPTVVGGDLEAIADTRFEAAMDKKVRQSFASMFPAPRQAQVDSISLPEEAFERMDRQILLVHGRDDGIIPLETSLYLLERLPRVRLHVFGQCKHWIMVEYKEAFNRLLASFFGEVDLSN